MNSTPLLTGSYDPWLVCLSVAIAAMAAYAALDLAGRLVKAHGDARIAWLFCGAIAMGSGIWAMHYIGMQAYRLPIPVLYDWPTVLLSLFTAIVASGVGLFIVSRRSVQPSDIYIGSVAVGGGIAAMHYIGMDAMRLRAMCSYSPTMVAVSIAFAIAISFCALRMVFSLRETQLDFGWRKGGAAALMGFAIAGMHYTGMAAVTFVPTLQLNGRSARSVSVSALSLSAIVITICILLSVVFLTAYLNRRFALSAQQLAESELRLQIVFDNMSEGIVVMDKHANIVLINRAGHRLLSLQDEDKDYSSVMSKFEVFSPEWMPILPEDWPSQRALRGEFVRDFQLLYRHRVTGQTGAMEISTAPVANRTGEDFQVIVTYRDATERWLVDQARNRLVAIVESSDDAIVGKDATGIITSWNRGAERVFGYSAQEMVGQSIKRLLPPGREHEEEEILRRILSGQIVDHFETVRKTKAGSLIHVSLTISPIRDSSGKIVGASKIARDITEKRLLEGQLHQSQKLEAVGQLTGGIAHDFNNLLGIIVGNLDLTERLVLNQPAVLKRVQTAQDAAARGADLTRRLLSFASHEELHAVPTELAGCILNILELAGRALGPKINLTTDFSAEVPPVLIDVNRFENAILNLVVNARDAMPSGGTISISARCRVLDDAYPSVHAGALKPGRYARICISDNGVGMSPETISRAFEPFFTTKPRGKGTGLGLAMVYGFVKQSGGVVRIYSEPGFGTTISLYLPLAESNLPTVDEDAFVAPAIPAGKVLIVDDEEDLLEVAAIYLVDAGYEPVRARNSAEAIEILEQQPDIGLVITDIVMGGGLNGVGLVKRAREICPDIRYLYCSGFPSEVLSERNVSFEDGSLLLKPYQRREFHAAIQHVMRQTPGATRRNELSSNPR